MEYIKGLSKIEVERRTKAGLVNSGSSVPTKSFKDIIRTNTLTFFNFLNIGLAIAVILVGSFESLFFMGVVLCNTFIGVIQEIRAKRIIDKLTLISQPKAEVVRDGLTEAVDFEKIVLGDLIKLNSGMQVCADCEIKIGECEVNESLLTGESDLINKKPSDKLMAGSFIASGEVFAEVFGVGKDNFANKIMQGAKYLKKPNSKMFLSMNRIVKGISVCILPMMLILFYQSLYITNQPFDKAVISTVAATIGMIPEGLVLLISIVMAISALRLSRHNTLVQEMYCIETLARVDVLCLDKTGTITEGKMRVEEIVPINRSKPEQIESVLGILIHSLPDNNPTAKAIRARFKHHNHQPINKIYPFSSERKWSGVSFGNGYSYVIGAAEFILKDKIDTDLTKMIEDYSDSGQRVVILAESRFDFNNKELPKELKPIALIIIGDTIREEAMQTLNFFKEQGVDIKIISGDNPLTVKRIAMKAGMNNVPFIDMGGVENDEIKDIVEKYIIFGRVNPAQKLEIIKSLKSLNHTVGMTGDGVNDVLALKEADCSIAMQSGSDAARNVSNLILLDNNFASIPKIVAEGRRSINNVERSASLFLSKTVYAFIIGLIYIFVMKPYPFVPIQMTLINALFIGIPSFFLALEPNYNLVKGEFIENVLKKSIPFGLCNITGIIILTILGHLYALGTDEIRTIATIIFGTTSFLILCRICLPFNLRRIIMAVLLGAGFVFAVRFFGAEFSITPFTGEMVLIIIATTIISIALVSYLPLFAEWVVKKK